MPIRLGILSDVHASPAPMREALSWFDRQDVDRIICAGDIAGYYEELDDTVELLQQHNVETISGNHDTTWLEKHPQEESNTARFLRGLPRTLNFDFEGITLYVVHAEPPEREHGGIKLLDVDGNVIDARREEWSKRLERETCDVMIVGHTHQVFAESLADILVINPGSSIFNHSCALLELPSKRLKFHALGGREILKSWNFSMLHRSSDPYPRAGS